MTPSDRRFELPGGLSPAEEAAVIAALVPILADGSGVSHNYVVVETQALAHRRLRS